MKITYLANIRLPTEKAHGFQIMKMCESFAGAGAEVELLVPTRENPALGQTDPFEYYGIKANFSVRRIFSFDPKWILKFSRSGIYAKTQFVFFSISVFWRLLFLKDKNLRLFYTRDEQLLPLLTFFSKRVVWEGHALPKHSDLYLKYWKRCEKIVTLTGAMKKILVGTGLGTGDVMVAPDGVDLAIFDVKETRAQARKILELPAEATILGYTGTLKTKGRDKGVIDCLKALTLLKNKIPRLHFLAVGGSQEDIRDYQELARRLGVDGLASFLPKVKQDKLALYQRACDIMLMPFPHEAHYANFMSPLKMFEYMASRNPIIATRLPAVEEVLNDGNALLVPPGKPESLAGAVEKVIADRQLGRHLAEQALADAREFTWQKRAGSILNFIK